MIRELRLKAEGLLVQVPGLHLITSADQDAPVGPDGTVDAYCRVWPTPPVYSEFGDLCGGQGSGQWRFQVTCAGGTMDKAEWSMRRVIQTFTPRVRLTPDTGIVRFEYAPINVMEDTTITPERWFYPVLFTLQLP